MRIRLGFVSNSSSTSFFVEADALYQTVFDLAEMMIPIRNVPELDEADLLRLQELRARGVDPDTPLSFYSSNFDTYILPLVVDGQKFYAVSTCNNTWWMDEIDTVAPSQVPVALWGLLGAEIGDLEFLNVVVERSTDFLRLESGVVGRRPLKYRRYQPCPDHRYGTRWVNPEGKPVCVDCGTILKEQP